MFWQGWAIPGFLGSICGSRNCNIACYSRRLTSTEANALMDSYPFSSESFVFTDDLLSGTQTFVSLGSTFLHNRLISIDDFAVPRNANPALEIVYVSWGFWNFTPFGVAATGRISQNRWTILQWFNDSANRSPIQRSTIQSLNDFYDSSTIWSSWTLEIVQRFERLSFIVQRFANRSTICAPVSDLLTNSVKSFRRPEIVRRFRLVSDLLTKSFESFIVPTI